jgi:hypothetical protein
VGWLLDDSYRLPALRAALIAHAPTLDGRLRYYVAGKLLSPASEDRMRGATVARDDSQPIDSGAFWAALWIVLLIATAAIVVVAVGIS